MGGIEKVVRAFFAELLQVALDHNVQIAEQDRVGAARNVLIHHIDRRLRLIGGDLVADVVTRIGEFALIQRGPIRAGHLGGQAQ